MRKVICTSKIHSNQSTSYLSTGRKKLSIKELKNTKALIYYSKATDVYVNLEDYNATKEKGVIDNTINWC